LRRALRANLLGQQDVNPKHFDFAGFVTERLT
jgi:hypothetical protein